MRRLAPVLLCAAALACGSDPAAPNNGAARNVQPISVNSGIKGNYANGVFTSVTVCVPGTSSCQTVDDVLVDTGSIGLRLVASGTAGGALTLALPQQNASDGNPLTECTQFLDGFIWGPIRLADVKLAGEQARTVPMQVVGETAFASKIPSACTSQGLAEEDSVSSLGANGILGVGAWRQDCGDACTAGTTANLYFSCASSGCGAVTVNLSTQVQNPVWMFQNDNNGVVVQLPAMPASGAPSASGSLIFGIGTAANNALGGATVFALDGYGNFNTQFGGIQYGSSFLDTGSNGLFFNAPIPGCTKATDFYCPASTQSLTAVNSAGGQSKQVAFSVANADALFSTPNAAFSNLAGTNPPGSFDWGLPFFFGRTVFVGIEGQSTPGGAGPYVAY